jgi:hypothetical protein
LKHVLPLEWYLLIDTFLCLFNWKGRLMPKMELDKPANTQPAERQIQSLEKPEKPETGRSYDELRGKWLAERATRERAPAMAEESVGRERAHAMEESVVGREKSNRVSERTPELRQSNLKREIDLADAKVAEIDEQLKPDNVRKAALEKAKVATLDEVMADPMERLILREHLKSEFSVENLEYMEYVERFELDPSKANAQIIYDKFVPLGAPSQANLGTPERLDIQGRVQDIPVALAPDAHLDRNFFEESREVIHKLVRSDSLPRLRAKPVFKDYYVEVHGSKISNDLKAQRIEAVRQSEMLKSQLLTEQLQNGQ